MNTQLTVIPPSTLPDRATMRELAVAAWLAEKAELSQSSETRRAYDDTMIRFRQSLQLAGLDLDAETTQVKLVAQAFASAGRVKAATHNRRLAIISSFYTYAIEGGLLEPPNPIDTVKRRKVQPYRAARALDADVVRRELAAIDRARRSDRECDWGGGLDCGEPGRDRTTAGSAVHPPAHTGAPDPIGGELYVPSSIANAMHKVHAPCGIQMR